MQNDYQDDFEGQEGSEYHFTDEDVNYEGEEEPGKTTEEVPAAKEKPQTSIFNKLMQSKRLLISGVVFIVLVFAVYKMVAPTSTEPSTVIAKAPTQVPSPTTVAQTNQPLQHPEQPIAAAQSTTVEPATPATMPAQNVAQIPPQQLQHQVSVQGQPIQTTQQPMMATQTNMQPYQQIVPPAATTVPPTTQAVMPHETAQTQVAITQPAVLMPQTATIPVQSTTQTVLPTQNVTPNNGLSPAFIVANNPNIDEKLAQMAANSERMMGQLQGQYTQQYNDFANQTRAIQEQMQAMSARVSIIEGQLNQLIQALTKKNNLNNTNNNQTGAMNTPKPIPAPALKLAYNVQAIIPGRAWLKSDNGETLTVAEGDMIKGVGRVTKIDPYDGIVELSTGTRSISLSYGENA